MTTREQAFGALMIDRYSALIEAAWKLGTAERSRQLRAIARRLGDERVAFEGRSVDLVDSQPAEPASVR